MQQRMAREEIVAIECRYRRQGGKLVECSAILRGCKVEDIRIEGEFFADPELDEKVESVKGLEAREALQRLRETLREAHAEPLEDIEACIERLLSACIE